MILTTMLITPKNVSWKINIIISMYNIVLNEACIIEFGNYVTNVLELFKHPQFTSLHVATVKVVITVISVCSLCLVTLLTKVCMQKIWQ